MKKTSKATVQMTPQGMSLRDWFAGMALNGMLSSDAGIEAISRIGRENNKTPTCSSAIAAYEVADAMLAERGAS